MNQKTMFIILAVVVVLFIVLLTRPVDKESAPATPTTPTAPTATGPAMMLEAPSNVNVGQEFAVEIKATGMVDVLGFEGDISYNPDVLEYVTTEEGDFFNMKGTVKSMMLDVLDAETPGLVQDIVIVKLGPPGVDGDGTIASVHFKAKAAGPADLDFDVLKVGDTSSNLIDVNSKTTSVTVQ